MDAAACRPRTCRRAAFGGDASERAGERDATPSLTSLTRVVLRSAAARPGFADARDRVARGRRMPPGVAARGESKKV